MKPFTKILLPVVIIIINTACSTYIPVTHELPPEIQLNEKPGNIGFVNLFDPSQLDYTKEKKTEVFSESIQHFTKGLDEAFKKDSTYNVVILEKNIAGKANTNLPNPVSKDSVVLLCKDDDVDLLLILEAYDIYFDKEVDVEKNEDGSKTKTAYFDLVVFAGLSLYDNNGEVINRSKMYNRDFYKSREVASTIFTIHPSLAKAGEETGQLSYELGNEYINKFYPGYKIESEKFYIGKEFTEILKNAREENWYEVIKMLKPLTESDDEKIRNKAAFNLAVAFKAIGEYEISEKWKEKAESLKSK